MTVLGFHSIVFFLFCIPTLLFSVLFFDEENPHDKRILFFAFLISALFMLCAAKAMLEISLLP